jgi:exodeoxyribonuclease VIII
MLDIETLGNGYDAMIVAIGAVSFGKDGLGKEFYLIIDPEKAKGSISPSTVKWWMQQSSAARDIFKKGTKSVSEMLALMEFQIFAGLVCNRKDLKVWGNGCSFDNVILKSAYERNRLQLPWEYWNDRCFRTFKAMYPKTPYEVKGTKHNALDDAKSQALHMVKLLNG